MKLPIIGSVPHERLFDDELTWEVPESSDSNSESSTTTEQVPQYSTANGQPAMQQHVNQAFRYGTDESMMMNHYVRPIVPVSIQYVKKDKPVARHSVTTDTNSTTHF